MSAIFVGRVKGSHAVRMHWRRSLGTSVCNCPPSSTVTLTPKYHRYVHQYHQCDKYILIVLIIIINIIGDDDDDDVDDDHDSTHDGGDDHYEKMMDMMVMVIMTTSVKIVTMMFAVWVSAAFVCLCAHKLVITIKIFITHCAKRNACFTTWA